MIIVHYLSLFVNDCTTIKCGFFKYTPLHFAFPKGFRFWESILANKKVRQPLPRT